MAVYLKDESKNTDKSTRLKKLLLVMKNKIFHKQKDKVGKEINNEKK